MPAGSAANINRMISRRSFTIRVTKFLSFGLLLPIAEVLNACTYKNKEEEVQPNEKGGDPPKPTKTIKILTPEGNTRWVIGRPCLVSWEAEHVEKFHVQLYLQDNLYTTLVSNLNALSYNWTVGPLNIENTKLRIVDATDASVFAHMEIPIEMVTEFEIDLNAHTGLQTIGGSKVFETVSLRKFLVKRISLTEYVSFSMVCTHNGCIIAVEQDTSFSCHCHGSAFDASGNVTNGPASLPLNRYRTEYFSDESKVVVYSY